MAFQTPLLLGRMLPGDVSIDPLADLFWIVEACSMYVEVAKRWRKIFVTWAVRVFDLPDKLVQP
jgi:hypothetical protein